MHVLHLIDALAIGGAERMLVEIANRTIEDHRTSVCVSRTQVDLASRLDDRIEILVLGRQRRFDVRPLLRLARWCKQHDVDLIHCHGRSSFSLAAALRATRLLEIPIVIHDHLGIEIDSSVPRWFRVARRYISHYVGVYAKHEQWACRAGVPPERIKVISNAIDVRVAAEQKLVGPPLPERAGRFHVITVGGLRAEKATDVLLDAVSLLRTPTVLHVVGGDADPVYARRCRERAERSDLRDRVVFHGARPDAVALAATADLAVHSSRSESGPLVLLEYAAHALPFVSTRVGGIATTLAEAGVGRFVEPEQPDKLAMAIDEVLAMSIDERRRLGQSLQAAALQFDIHAVIDKWYAVYRRSIENPR